MKTKIFLLCSLLVFLISSRVSFSQVDPEWVKRYFGSGNDVALAITTDKDGYVYVTGYATTPADSRDIITIKYDSLGNTIWAIPYQGGNGNDEGRAIAADNAGNVYVTGYSATNPGGREYKTIKYNSAGTMQWFKSYVYDDNVIDASFNSASSIAVDFLGNVWVTGSSSVPGQGLDFATIKYSPTGSRLFVIPYGSTAGDEAVQIKVDQVGDAYVTGRSTGSGYDYYTVKYSSSGGNLWARRYNNDGVNGSDEPSALAIDENRNVFVTGRSMGSDGTFDYCTVKYDISGAPSGLPMRYSKGGIDEAKSISINGINVYVTGRSAGSGTSDDFATVMYSSIDLSEIWDRRYNGYANGSDIATALTVDPYKNIFVTGQSIGSAGNNDYVTIKYNQYGDSLWVSRYDGPAHNFDMPNAIAASRYGNVYVTGTSDGTGSLRDYATLKFAPGAVTHPAPYSVVLPEVNHTIKWNQVKFDFVNIKCIINYHQTDEEEILIGTNIPVPESEYVWEIPAGIITANAKIIIENSENTQQKILSQKFRIRSYFLARIEKNDIGDSVYHAYDISVDKWNFVHDTVAFWPEHWYRKFNYRGIDSFTTRRYLSIRGNVFTRAQRENFPDWHSWVNAFTKPACYSNVDAGIYLADNLLKWRTAKKSTWGGSCYGIAESNARVFRNKEEFFEEFPDFPHFENPVEVDARGRYNSVRKTINQFQTLGYTDQDNDFRRDAGTKSPKQTLEDIKELLLSDNREVVPVTIVSNDIRSPGAHAVVPISLEQDEDDENIYYLYVFNVNNPDINIPIVINSSGAKGFWNYADGQFDTWGGDKGFFLSRPLYSDQPDEKTKIISTSLSTTTDSILKVYNSDCDIRITDQNGNIAGYCDSTLYESIPGSFPLIAVTGFSSEPYGYYLNNGGYSVITSNFSSGYTSVDFSSGSKMFSYERDDANTTQTDKLHFGENLSVKNTDPSSKSITIKNIIIEPSQQKAFNLFSIELQNNDSIKVVSPDNNNLLLISHGSAKDYEIELELVSSTSNDFFKDLNVHLPANSSHTLMPDWSNVSTNNLVVLQDLGNNGTFDDTLYLTNHLPFTLHLKALIEGFYDTVVNKMKEDDILIHLRNAVSPFEKIDSSSAILDSAGRGEFSFNNITNGTPYYIELKHRNSIETWSKEALMFSSDELNYDFTTSSQQAFGDNLKLKGSKYCIYGGDINQDGVVDLKDILMVHNGAEQMIEDYTSTDVTGDGFTDIDDLIITYNNSYGFVRMRKP